MSEMTVRTEQYVIQCRRAQGDAPAPLPWVDYRPLEPEVTELQRRNLLSAHRQQEGAGRHAEWRLIRRIVIEEDVEAAATGRRSYE